MKFDNTTKGYQHKLEFVLENETLKILWDFVIQTDHLNSARREELVINNEKKKKKQKQKKNRIFWTEE